MLNKKEKKKAFNLAMHKAKFSLILSPICNATIGKHVVASKNIISLKCAV